MEIERARAFAAADEARRVLAAAPGVGLLDTQAFRVAEALGLRVPRYVVLPPHGTFAGSVRELATDRVVVKVLAAGLSHKADVGGVAFTDRDPVAVAAAIAAMQRRLPPDVTAAGFLVAEHLAHDTGPEGEILFGARWSAAFGPVVVLGPGGPHAENADGAAFFGPDDDLAAAVTASDFGRRLIDRGRISAEDLIGLVATLRSFAIATMPGEVGEFEVNPLVLAPDGPTALDAVLRPSGGAPAAASPRPLHRVGRLLAPQRLAIVGVSGGDNPGRIILRNVLAAGFPPDRVIVIKPGADRIEGCRCVASLAELPAPVDLIVIATGAHQVPALIDEVVAGRRAEAVIVIAAGLGEQEGTAHMRDRLAKALATARHGDWGGPVVNGGNCLGVRSVPGRIDTFFVPASKLGPAPAEGSPVALLAQSGAFLLSRLDHMPWLRPRYAVSVGNEVDLTIADYLEHLAGDREVAAFGCYVEGLAAGDGRRFLQAARTIRQRGGAVVLYAGGRTSRGASAAASHTAAVAVDPRVLESLAVRAGVLVAATLEEFEDLITLCVRLAERAATGMRLGAMSNAGFECVAVADHAPPLTLATLGPATLARLGEVVGAPTGGTAVAGHPLDVTPMAPDGAFAAAAETLLADPAVDVGLVGCVPFTGALDTGPGPGAPHDLAARLVALWNATTKAWVAVVDAGAPYDPLAAELTAAGIPVFRHADRAVRALGRYVEWRTSGAGG